MQNPKLSTLLEKFEYRDFLENALSCKEIVFHFKWNLLFIKELMVWLYYNKLQGLAMILYFLMFGTFLFVHWYYKSEEARKQGHGG